MDNFNNNQVYSGVYDITTITSIHVIVTPIFLVFLSLAFTSLMIYIHIYMMIMIMQKLIHLTIHVLLP
jgi:hypothetical protein